MEYYSWYSEEGTERAAAPPSPLLAVDVHMELFIVPWDSQ